MKYLIVQEWNNTRGNHAGMSHMCDLLVSLNPSEYVKISMDVPEPRKVLENKYLRKLLGKIEYLLYIRRIRRRYRKKYLQICTPMFSKLKRGDEVFLLEYNLDEAPQYDLACYIRRQYPYVKIYALSHLAPSRILKKSIAKNVVKWDAPVDKELTLGNSLSNFFVELGVPREKINTGFHYVDSVYYKKNIEEIITHDKLTVIAMGALQRDFKMLSSIVNRTSGKVNWIICRGEKKDVDHFFVPSPNIYLKGYLSEEELRGCMSSADISLNVLEDTVGSNVIVTSLAMGLAIIVSDVGSIRDYCDDTSAIFCKNTEDSFVAAIELLCGDQSRVRSMRLASLRQSQKLCIEKVDEWFNSLGESI